MIQGDSFVMYDLPASYALPAPYAASNPKSKRPKLSNLFSTLGMGWNKKSGLTAFGKNIGKTAPLI